jgi:DNA replication and repair protein RecF
MFVETLSLNNFRNHSSIELAFARHINLITGPNGAGKTSIIDAVHYLCMSRSFVSTSDQYCVKFGNKEFILKASFKGEIRSGFDLKCTYQKGQGKSFEVNGANLERITDLVGRVPVVVLSPEDKELTTAGPIVRRSFIDAFISQLSKPYLNLLIDYKKVIKQRNSLLQQAFNNKEGILSLLEPWNAQLADKGARIIYERLKVLAKFRSHLQKQYKKISSIPLVPDIGYKTALDVDVDSSLDEITQQFMDQLAKQYDKECERGVTLVGPQRDDLHFTLNNKDVRYYGSQGQHRLFAFALKVAQLFYYEDELEDLPIFLMDDVFGDIDKEKIGIILTMLSEHKGQLFITAANESLFNDFHLNAEIDQHFFVGVDGSVSSNSKS